MNSSNQMLNNESLSKNKYLESWLMSLRNFLPDITDFSSCFISVRIIRFDEDILSIEDDLFTIVNDEKINLCGIVWVDSGLEKYIPCIIYDNCFNMTFQSSISGAPLEKHTCPIINILQEAISETKMHGFSCATVFQSKRYPRKIGWMPGDSFFSLASDKKEKWKTTDINDCI